MKISKYNSISFKYFFNIASSIFFFLIVRLRPSGQMIKVINLNNLVKIDCELIDVFQLLKISIPTFDWALAGSSKNLI